MAPSHFQHDAPGHSSWIYAVHGRIEVAIENERITLPKGKVLAMKASERAFELNVRANVDGHAVIVAGELIAEGFVQHGPFVTSTEAEITEVKKGLSFWTFGRAQSLF